MSEKLIIRLVLEVFVQQLKDSVLTDNCDWEYYDIELHEFMLKYFGGELNDR